MEELEKFVQGAVGLLNTWLSDINGFLALWVITAALLGAGIYTTYKIRAVQFRYFGRMLSQLRSSHKGAEGGISSLQAFAMGMATRIGIGNVTGVALAIILGGPGALFWMWIVAIIGMATSFCEACLAQIFKVTHPDKTFRGGPATYIRYGIRSKYMALIFAALMVFSMVVAMPMVQSNAISGLLESSHGVSTWVSALVVSVLVGIVVVGGVRSVASVTQWVSPLMAISYLVVALVVIVINHRMLPTFFVEVFSSAFGFQQILGGAAGGITAAILNGVRRGLFSNEAGMGTAPNAAATATVKHPVQQALVQSFGVFLDTILVCSATGFMIITSGLLANSGLTDKDSSHLTADAIVGTIGSWMAIPLSVMVFVFAYSSILGSYTYAEANLVYLGVKKQGQRVARILMVISTGVGAILELRFVWNLMDLFMVAVTIINLVAIFGLSKWVVAVTKDYERQLRGGVSVPVFDPESAHLPAKLPTNGWKSGMAPAGHRKTS